MKNYRTEIQKFITSQYLYAGLWMAFAIVAPALVLAYFGLLKEYFLWPLATSFVGLTDLPGPFIRRRNTLIAAILFFTLIAAVTSLLKDFPPLVYLQIVVFGIFFSMIGVYGQRLASVGGLSLVVFSIFVDGHLTGTHLVESLLVFALGCVWFFLVFLALNKLQPYKLARQMIGENYLELAQYLRIKARFYENQLPFDAIRKQFIAQQVVIKNLQEETRELVFKTRTFVNESTTTSRVLMLIFLNSIDFYEKLFTSEQDYRKLHQDFQGQSILPQIHDYLLLMAEEIAHIGLSLQRGTQPKPLHQIPQAHHQIHEAYFDLRNKELSGSNLEKFMSLRTILHRINEITEDIQTIYKVASQDPQNAKSLSTGLDFEKFVPRQEKLNRKVFFNNFSLKSSHFRHALRITAALLVGYGVSQIKALNIGHSYWILITIIAIMRPAYSTTKHRNKLRLYGTVSGAVTAYLLLVFIPNDTLLLGVLLGSMILCFSLLKIRYASAVFFMTIYIFITFNFLNPGNVHTIFKDRLVDTVIAGAIAVLASYFILPVWEHTQTIDLMKASLKANQNYFHTVMAKLQEAPITTQQYKIARREAIINLANLSDNFQRMLSDPKNQRRKMEMVHQFVNTSHLITAYTASLSRYSGEGKTYPEIDAEKWSKKILAETNLSWALLNGENIDQENKAHRQLTPEDLVVPMLMKRKNEIDENDLPETRDPNKITKLTELKSLRELLILIYDVAREQRKLIEHYQSTLYSEETAVSKT
ncbi:FUSC family protein [Bergeyella sp. RCAD1439]|uniref:FUSC family protein n=1 Tax=Bergeyella anatis TaxID=3113737 RepID=UPI002E17D6BA|nr:FUSC family membrane protein [Bergeyella sp. RCAD1439]